MGAVESTFIRYKPTPRPKLRTKRAEEGADTAFMRVSKEVGTTFLENEFASDTHGVFSI